MSTPTEEALLAQFEEDFRQMDKKKAQEAAERIALQEKWTEPVKEEPSRLPNWVIGLSMMGGIAASYIGLINFFNYLQGK